MVNAYCTGRSGVIWICLLEKFTNFAIDELDNKNSIPMKWSLSVWRKTGPIIISDLSGLTSNVLLQANLPPSRLNESMLEIGCEHTRIFTDDRDAIVIIFKLLFNLIYEEQ